jgi:probable F420-dependent oxidoreductase
MRIGAIYPQAELGGDTGAVRAYAQAVTDLGYDHLLVYDHVVGADPEAYPGWRGPYDVDTTFHEPFVLFGYLAALTPIELVTGIIILPQRQTALVAKQAAEVDLLTGGRFRLGVGVGWNRVEYEALGQDFATRGAREDEQIQLLRRLWTERSVTHHGRFDTVVGAGLAPLPVQRPIPIWLGCASAPAFRRAGRLGDGWFPMVHPGPELDQARAIVDQAARDAGRDPAAIGMEGRIEAGTTDPDALGRQVESWRQVGATHLTLGTMHADLADVDAHIAVLTRAAETAGLTPR